MFVGILPAFAEVDSCDTMTDRSDALHRLFSGALTLTLFCGFGAVVGCDEDTPEEPAVETPEAPAEAPEAPEAPEEPARPAATSAVGDDLANGLLVVYSPFEQSDSGQWTQPGAARLEMHTRSGGEWHMSVVSDADSNVFHKAIPYTLWGQQGIITIGGMKAMVKFWTRNDAGEWSAELLWKEEFGGRISRMRDIETVTVGGVTSLAIATHDQGYLALLTPAAARPEIVAPVPTGDDYVHTGFTLRRSAKRENMFVHEIEVGDLDGDGTPEIYATPSEPNHMDGGAQAGEVVRFLPTGEGELETTVVANLGNRHAKEILVDDVDGDGRDELYVSVEGLTERGESGINVVEAVEVRRYDHDTPADARVVIGRIEGDHLMRFLTAGDVDGDGKKELVAAAFSRGLWLMRPGTDPRGEWGVESFDRESGGFEHTSYLADLDGNGSDELYVASDNHGEIRRYAWVNGRARRSVVSTREVPRQMITWNIVSAPRALIAP